jgi:hypothetical protein
VQLERLDPETLQPQTQKKEVLSDHGKYTREGKKIDRKYTKEDRERNRKKNQWYRDEINSGFNLLMKWVPGTKTLIRTEIFTETVNYIKKLQNEIKEVKKESLKKSKKRENYIKELEKELLKKKVNYIEELQNKIKELETSQTAIDTDCTDSAQPLMSQEMVDGTVAVSTPMEIRVSSDEEEEELLGSPEEEMELLESGEELLEFNSMEDFRQWLEL